MNPCDQYPVVIVMKAEVMWDSVKPLYCLIFSIAVENANIFTSIGKHKRNQ